GAKSPSSPRISVMATSQPGSCAQSQEREPQPRPQSAGRGRGRSQRHRSPSVESAVSESGPEEISHSERHRIERRGKKRQGTLPDLDEEGPAGREVANAGQRAVNYNAGQNGGGGAEEEETGSGKPLKLRLDLNLSADIRLTAKVHGDVTLALL
ncbi:hypothetical protein AN958_07495, partial [Leucoagaricus sp. SymC.cos]